MYKGNKNDEKCRDMKRLYTITICAVVDDTAIVTTFVKFASSKEEASGMGYNAAIKHYGTKAVIEVHAKEIEYSLIIEAYTLLKG